MKAYFKKKGITAKVDVTNKSLFTRKPRVVSVTVGSEKYVFIDPKKSSYRKDWAKTLGKNGVPKGYDIDHVYAKSRAKGRFKFVMLQPVKSEVNRSVGAILEQRFARMSKTELKQYKEHADNDVKRGYRKAGPMQKIKLNAVHGVPEHKIKVPVADKNNVYRKISLKDFQERQFLKTSGKALSGSLGVAAPALIGVNITNALKDFYKSPVVANTKEKLDKGQYASARQYFQKQCLHDLTAKPVCEKLRKAISESSTILQSRIWIDFPDFAMYLYEKWEADARAWMMKKKALDNELNPPPVPPPANPYKYVDLSDSAYLTFRVVNALPRTALVGDQVSMTIELLGQIDDYWVRISGAPIQVYFNDTKLQSVTTDGKGVFTVTTTLPTTISNHQIKLVLKKQKVERKYFVSSYEYVVEADGDFPVGWSNGKDVITLPFKLLKRLHNNRDNVFTAIHEDYNKDFKSVAFQGRGLDVKVGQNADTMNTVVKLTPSAESGKMSIKMSAATAGDRLVVADLRGGKFHDKLVEVGKFTVKFTQHVPGLTLQWGVSMASWIKNGKLILPKKKVDLTKTFDIDIRAITKRSGNIKPVEGVAIKMVANPERGIIIGGNLAKTNAEGQTLFNGKKPYIWGAKEGNIIIEVSAPGASNSLEIEIEGETESYVPIGFNHHHYRLTPRKMLFNEAQDYARSVSGYLVTVNNQQEATFLVENFSGHGLLWIGFSDVAEEGKWVWNNGEGSSFTQWCGGEPNNMWSGGENYAAMFWGGDGCWNDLGEGSPEYLFPV